MKSAVRCLPKIMLLIVGLGIVACSTKPVPVPPKPADKPVAKKDYSALRIGGRETLKLPGIGILHADKRMEVEGGVLFAGRVFLEIALPPSGEKPTFLYAYAEKARCDIKGKILYLEGWAVVEGLHLVCRATEADTRIAYDETGKVTIVGGHETFLNQAGE